ILRICVYCEFLVGLLVVWWLSYKFSGSVIFSVFSSSSRLPNGIEHPKRLCLSSFTSSVCSSTEPRCVFEFQG
ncbi:unnamed protein product, partial [Prunus brigantina]